MDGKLRRSCPQDGVSVSALEAADYLHDIARGGAALHDMRFLFRDFKTRNIMLCNTEAAVADAERGAHGKMGKIGDLGLLYRLALGEQGYNKISGTLAYLAPECMHEQQPFTYASDVYAVGVLMWVLWFQVDVEIRYNAKLKAHRACGCVSRVHCPLATLERPRRSADL